MTFSHEKLNVYRRAIDFVAWTQPLIESLSTSVSARQQIERASTSIPLNLVEGNGKFSPRDRARYFQIATGSALECAACLDVIVARGIRSAQDVKAGKEMLLEIVNMTMGLLDHLGSRVAEDSSGHFEIGPGAGEEEED
jgi:four helix bundle protein